MFGSYLVHNRINGDTHTIGPISRQFSYFRVGNPIPTPGESFWLRDQISKDYFGLYYGDQRRITWAQWTEKYGVRPIVSIGG